MRTNTWMLAALVALAGLLASSACADEIYDPSLTRAFASSADDAAGVDPRIALTNYYNARADQRMQTAPQPPPDPYGPQRMLEPTPNPGYGLHGVDHTAYNTASDAKTVGIRLDTSYGVLRETHVGVYSSEYQTVTGGGFTILPYQSPCLIMGTKILGNFISNNAMVANDGGFSLDFYLGTRYKELYFKIGPIWDYQGQFSKVGIAPAILTNIPVVGNMTFDMAFAWGQGNDVFGPTFDPINNLIQRRVEVAKFDGQIRVGKFLSPYCQVGGTGNWYQWSTVPDEWGGGAFTNLYWGRFMLGLDLTGGTEGLRGFAQVGYSWGSRPCDHPQDCRFIPLDTVAWITRAVNRDISLRLRDSFTGPLRPLVFP